MTDYTELKRLAEAVKQTYADLCERGGEELADAWDSAELAYDDAANPGVVLALIAENERLSTACTRAEQVINAESKAAAIATGRANLLQAERDQLKAENEALASSRAKLAGELSRLRAKHKDWSVDAAMGKGEQS